MSSAPGPSSNGARHDVTIVRHGATEWSQNGRHTGTTDLPLLPEGVAQAEAAGALLGGQRFSLVLTSPLRRARHARSGSTTAAPTPTT